MQCTPTEKRKVYFVTGPREEDIPFSALRKPPSLVTRRTLPYYRPGALKLREEHRLFLLNCLFKIISY